MADGSPRTSGPSSTKCSPRHGNATPPKLAGFLDGSRKEADWASSPGNELIFPLDVEEDAVDPELQGDLFPRREGFCPEGLHTFPGTPSGPSPPEPGILGALPTSPPASLSPQRPSALAHPQGPAPLANLVKSVSTEIEGREGSPLKPQPLLSLVKSISTEISRLEPEVTPSKSDSKLNVHLWRQITQPKGRDGDSRTAPSSPNTSPSEAKGGFFKAQEARFEDTKRRFSEAMQEPLQRLSKIMGDDNNVSPKHKAQDSPSGHAKVCATSEARAEGPERDPPRTLSSPSSRRARTEEPPTAEPQWEPSLDCRYEICSYGDVIQVVEVAPGQSGPPEEGQGLPPVDAPHPSAPGTGVPGKALAGVALLAYNYFVLPLPPYVSGLCLGVACGFLLGFLVILLLVPTRTRSPRRRRQLPRDPWPSEGLGQQPREPSSLQGWMNEMYFYDPELYHPSVTHSVFVTLEEDRLKLSYPKNNIPRRATFEEAIVDVALVSHRHYDLKGAKVFLCPPGLARKRTWNKKYPICVLFPAHLDPDSHVLSGQETEQPKEGLGSKKRQTPSPETPLKYTAEAQERTLYLFGRTGRDKEEWFQHLVKASRGESGPQQNANLGFNQLSPSRKGTYSSSSSRGSTEDLLSAFKPKDLVMNVREELLLGYDKYMSHLVPPVNGSSPPESPSPTAMGSPTPEKFPGDADLTGEPHTAWVNALLGRMFWDFLREKYWADQVSNKIQKKLGRIKLPYFMNELTLTELDMGASIPHILSASSPTVDNRGLWVDMEVTYSGSLQMTLETKMNLYKLGKEATGEDGRQADGGHEGTKAHLVLLADSDAESSSAGSSDEEDFPPVETAGVPGERNAPPGAESHVGGNSTSRKILRFVDKIAKSKYFQKATENEFIKKKMEEVSNTPLLLTVEVQELTGRLAVNVPPPPTDRIWYSFRIPPQLDLKVRPKLGEREVTFIHVTEWIEKKLQHEFQKILVMPHMDDLILPLMHSGLEYPPPIEELRRDLPGEDARDI